MERTGKSVAAFLIILALFLRPANVSAAVIAARHKEVPSHGFLVIRTLDGKTLASGDLIQTAKPDRSVSRFIFHFKDGSLHDETTEFSQRGDFRLLKDHLIQKGPAFKVQLETVLDATTGEFKAWSQDSHGKQKQVTKHLDLPPDVFNGLVWTILKNIDPKVPRTTVSVVAASTKPRVVKLHIIHQSDEPFSVAGSPHKAEHFVIQTEITGPAGVVAPLLGKKPPDTNAWILSGAAPAFLKSEGPIFEDGPIWRVELAKPVGPEPSSSGSGISD